MKKMVSIFLILGALLCSNISLVRADEYEQPSIVDNYGVCTEDIYIPSLPELDDMPNATTLQSYNPLQNDRATPIKDQGRQGTCAIFATNAIMETTGLVKTGLKYDLSEESMRFILSNQLKYNNNTTSDTGFYLFNASEGRDFNITSTYITNINNPIIENNNIDWVSPNLSSDVPYTNVYYSGSTALPNNMNASYSSYCATGTRYINEEEIKDYILSNGAVYVTFYTDETNGFNKETNSFYFNDEGYMMLPTVDHAVAVVGWDDNYPVENFSSKRRPSQSGAWLVKNSWGIEEDKNDNGYYWISYEDTSFNYHHNAAIITDVNKRTKNEYMLAYDFMPMTTHRPYVLSNSQDSIYMTNVYDLSDFADIYGSISKVMFYSNQIGSFYRIYLTPLDSTEDYPNISNLGTSLYADYIDAEGYITANLPDEYIFDENTEKIAVTVKIILDDESTNKILLSMEGQHNKYKTSISSGQSYVYHNNSWSDISTDGTVHGNFCIRPTLVRRTPITQNSTLSSNSLDYIGEDVTVNLNLNGNLLYSIKENGNTLLYEDTHFTRTDSSVTFKSSYLSSLSLGQYKNIVFEFTDGDIQTLRITKKANLPDVTLSGKFAVNQTVSAVVDSTSTTGISYQWQTSSDGTTWTDIANANNSTYTIQSSDNTKYLRCKISSTSDSNYVYPHDKTAISPHKVVIFGDANLDGRVSVTDNTAVQKYVIGMEEFNAEQLVAADVDGDGAVTVQDATLISKYANGLITTFPVEEN